MQPLATLAEPIQAGVTIGNHWIAEAPLPPRAGVQHWEGVAVEAGTPVEILRLSPDADPLQQRDFLHAHHVLSEQPAGLKPLYTGADSTIIRPFARASLADIERRLTTEEVVALVGWFGPTLLALNGGVGGLHTDEEFVIDDADIFRIAPLSAPGQPLPSLPDEQIPPELRLGGPPSGASSLYSLGVVLYRALTGINPEGGADASGAPLPPPPPSQTVAGLDHRADRLLMALLDPDPQRRISALPPPPLRPPTFHQEQQADTAEPAEAGLGALFSAPYIVVIMPRGVKPAALKTLSGWLGVPPDTIRDIALAGLPVPLFGASDQNKARLKSAEYSAMRLPARTIAMAPSLPFYTTVWAGLLIAVAGVALGLGLDGWLAGLAALMGLMAIPATMGHDIWYARQIREAFTYLQRPKVVSGKTSDTTKKLAARARTLHTEISELALINHSGADLITALDMTIESLGDLNAAEQAGARSAAIASLQITLKKGLDAIETQHRQIANHADSIQEVELDTMLTRAISARQDAKRLRANVKV